MVAAVDDFGTDADHFAFAQRPLDQGPLEAIIDGRNELPRNLALRDLVEELVVLVVVLGQRENLAHDVRVLSRTAGLLLVLVVELDNLRRGLLVGHLRLTDLRLALVLALDAFDVDFEVQLPHPRDQRFARFRVAHHMEGRIFPAEAFEGLAQIAGVVPVGRFNRQPDDRLSCEDLLEGHRFQARPDEGVPRRTIDTDDGDDVAPLGHVDVLAFIGMQTHQSTKPHRLARTGVGVGFALLERPLIHAGVGQLTKLLDDRLEGHADRGLGRIGGQVDPDEFIGLDFPLLPSGFRLVVVDGRHSPVERAGQVGRHRVEQCLDALVLEGRSAHHRRDLVGERRLADDRDQLLSREFGLFQDRRHQFVVVHRQGFEHRRAVRLGLFEVVCRNRLEDDIHPLLAFVVDRSHLNEIDHAFEVRTRSDRNLENHRRHVQLVPDLLHHAEEVGSGTVHLVDEPDARHLVALHLAVDGQRLALDATDRAQHEDRPVENAQRPLHFHGEVHVAGGVDQVDRIVFHGAIDLGRAPGHLRRGAGDGDATFLFEVHEVHGGPVAISLDFFHLVDAARVKQNALAQRRLAGVDVGRDAQVADVLKVHWSATELGKETEV